MGIIKLTLCVVAASVAVVALYLICGYYQPSHPPKEFNSERWKSLSSVSETNFDPGCYRGGMALDVIERGILVGKQISEINDLLGRPNSTTAGQWVYDLGQCSGYGWEDSSLVINFGPKEIVKHAKFVRALPPN